MEDNDQEDTDGNKESIRMASFGASPRRGSGPGSEDDQDSNSGTLMDDSSSSSRRCQRNNASKVLGRGHKRSNSLESTISLTELSFLDAELGQQCNLTPSEMMAIEEAFLSAEERNDETLRDVSHQRSDDTDEDTEYHSDIEEETVMEVRRGRIFFDMLNLSLFGVGLVLIAIGSYARSSYWWTGGLVSWGLTTTLIVIIGGVVLFCTSLIGLIGSQAKSAWALLVYNILQGIVCFITILFGITCLILRAYVEEIVTDEWTTLQDVLPKSYQDDQGKDDLKRHLRENQLMLGATCVICGVFSGVACRSGLNLRRQILEGKEGLEEWLQINFILLMANGSAGIVALVCIGYGIYAVQMTYYTKFLSFLQYLFVLLGMVLLQVSIVGASLSSGTSFRHDDMMRGYRSVLIVCMVACACVAGLTLTRVNDVDDHVTKNWATINDAMMNQTSVVMLTKHELISLTEANLIIAACLENMEVWLLSIMLWASMKLHEELKQKRESNSEPPLNNNSYASLEAERDANPVTGFEQYVVCYCFFAAFIHVFWEGEYVVFHNWLINNKEEAPWFLKGWSAYIQADGRYGENDSFILAKESVAAIVGGPSCIFLAWATYERKPFRDVVALIVCITELYSVAITFGSGLMQSWHDNEDGDHQIYFWIIFVFVAILRLLAPMPILSRACNHVWTCVEYHDQHVKKGTQSQTTTSEESLAELSLSDDTDDQALSSHSRSEPVILGTAVNVGEEHEGDVVLHVARAPDSAGAARKRAARP